MIPDILKTPHIIRAINLTSMLDMVFNLLIFFILASNFSSDPSINLALPSAATAENESQAAPSISLTAEGAIYLDALPVASFGDLAGQLHALPKERLDRGIKLKADRLVPYHLVVDAMDVCRTQGLSNISLVMEENAR